VSATCGFQVAGAIWRARESV